MPFLETIIHSQFLIYLYQTQWLYAVPQDNDTLLIFDILYQMQWLCAVPRDDNTLPIVIY